MIQMNQDYYEILKNEWNIIIIKDKNNKSIIDWELSSNIKDSITNWMKNSNKKDIELYKNVMDEICMAMYGMNRDDYFDSKELGLL